MTINTLKDLDKLIALCRKRGIQSIKVDNVELKLGDMPTHTRHLVGNTKKQLIFEDTFVLGEISETTKIDTPDQLTQEQLLMWSAGTTSETL